MTVHRTKRNPTTYERELDTAGQPITDGELGVFVFKVPTVHDNLQIAAKRQATLAQVGDPKFLTEDFFLMAEVLATIPKQVKQAPPGWDWEHIYSNLLMLDIYQAYSEALEELRKKNKQMQ